MCWGRAGFHVWDRVYLSGGVANKLEGKRHNTLNLFKFL
jgi:hypothetical protein